MRRPPTVPVRGYGMKSVNAEPATCANLRPSCVSLDSCVTGMTMFARALHQEGQLRPDVSVEEAGDMLWTCNSPEVYELLVVQRGWTPERFGDWLIDAWKRLLLYPAAPARRVDR